MPKRIKLLLDLSGIDEGVSYVVYRRDTLPVLTDEPLIEVDEREVYKRVLRQEGEVLTQNPDAPLEFFASRIYMMMPMPSVYVDGTQIAGANISWLAKEKKIRIDNEQIEPGTTKVVTMDYNYLVSVVEDDHTVSQVGVIHHGTDVVTGLNPPVFKNYEFDKMTKEYKIFIERDVTPDSVWYQVALREDLTDRLSEMGMPQQILITPNLYDLSYRLEASKDEGTTWELLTDFTGNEVTLTNSSDITNYPPGSLAVTLTRVSGEVAQLDIQNPWYEWWNNTRPTHLFRIREEDTRREYSVYTELPRGGINYKPTKMKIRRKEANGSAALYEGFDALDMWELTEADVDLTQPVITLVDDHLIAGRVYSYTFYVDDEEGFRSDPFVYVTPIL